MVTWWHLLQRRQSPQYTVSRHHQPELAAWEAAATIPWLHWETPTCSCMAAARAPLANFYWYIRNEIQKLLTIDCNSAIAKKKIWTIYSVISCWTTTKMSCAVCSAGQLFVIRVKDNDYMFTKLPQETSKSCNDDYYYDITTTSDKISPEDVRGIVYMDI